MILPAIQAELRHCARVLRGEEDGPEALDVTAVPAYLEYLATQIRRRPGTRGPITSRPMTDAVRAQIRALAAQVPRLSQAEIARRVGVNPGRVSEVLRGFRT